MSPQLDHLIVGDVSGLPAVVGIADHRGWATLVCVGTREGLPVVLDRRRVDLVAPDLPSQPRHHEAVDLDLAEARELVDRVKRSAASCAHAALSRLRDDIGAKDRLVSIALREGRVGQVPDTLADVLTSQAAMIAADGALYLDALSRAAVELGIDVAWHPRGAELARAALALGVDSETVTAFLSDVGRELGPPWRKEQRSAAAAAISALGPRARLDGLTRA